MRNRPKTFFAQTIFLAHKDFFQLLLKMRKRCFVCHYWTFRFEKLSLGFKGEGQSHGGQEW